MEVTCHPFSGFVFRRHGDLMIRIVCRVASKRALFAREPVDEMATSDEIAAADANMFNEADTDHNGELSLAEFLAYAGASEGDKDLVVKFHT